MDRLAHKKMTAGRRAHRVRNRIERGKVRPRLSVHISNLHVTAQIIDDTTSKTLVYSTSVGRQIEGNLSDKASWVGIDVAKKASKAKLKSVIFDRGKSLYHGRVKILADAARKEGLEF